MHFSKELVTCKGRVVPACQVQRGNEQFVTPPNGDFSNNIKRKFKSIYKTKYAFT